MADLKEKISQIKDSVVAVGILISENQLKIVGSGFSVSDNDHILTAGHLFKNLDAEQLKKIVCMIATDKKGPLTGYSWVPVELVRKEEMSDTALLKIKSSVKSYLKPLELGANIDINTGQEVYFIGFPYAAELIRDGLGVTQIVNKGIISAIKHRAAEPHLLDWFFVDSISNPGNSGCPLLDTDSNKVIGVMSISFRMQSKSNPTLDIREPMHIAGAKPIGIVKGLLNI